MPLSDSTSDLTPAVADATCATPDYINSVVADEQKRVIADANLAEPAPTPLPRMPLNTERTEQLIGCGYEDETTARLLVGLPMDYFTDDHRSIIDAMRYQLEHARPYAFMRETFRELLNQQENTPAKNASLISAYSRCRMKQCKPSEVAALLDSLRMEYERKRTAFYLRTKQITIEEARERLNKTDEHPLTELGNAELFVDLYGHDLRFIAEWKSWAVWDGRKWNVDKSGTDARKKAMQLVRKDAHRLAFGIEDHDRRSRFIKYFIAKSQSKTHLVNVVSLAADMLTIRAAELDSHGHLLNVQNGTIDLSTDNASFREHRREDLLTKIAPVSFDRSATAPTWDRFIHRIFQDGDGTPRHDLVQYVQKAIGYSMTADISEQCFFVLHGCGQNGKTTLMDTVKHVLGDLALTAPESLLMKMERGRSVNSDDEAALFGVRLAACSETNEGQRFDESKVKRLTGNGEITAMRKFEHPFTFKATHKIWLDCNHLPRISGTDMAIWRRVKTIPFDVVIPSAERDNTLGTKLNAESNGILNWMLRGWHQWKLDGLFDSEPAEVRAAVKAYRDDNDTLGEFLRDCTEDSPAAKIATARLYDVYKQWCEGNGLDHPLSKIALGKKLKERRYESRATMGTRYYVGLDLRSDRDSETTAKTQTAEGSQPF